MDNRFHDIDLAATGTCDWLFRHDEYKRWAGSDRGLLWIKGKPGSGKSTLLKYALGNHKVRRDDLVLSFFFHGYGNELRRTSLGLFRSLLHQVLSLAPNLLPDLTETFLKRCKEFGKLVEEWQWDQEELRRFFELSLLKILETHSVWLFVDALDECDDKNAIDLIEEFKSLLRELPSTSSQLHICFTSRHYPVLGPMDYGFEICLEVENSEDISTYLQSQLSTCVKSEILAIIIPDIMERASGNFRWARLLTQRVLHLERMGEGWEAIEVEINATLPDPNTLDLHAVPITAEEGSAFGRDISPRQVHFQDQAQEPRKTDSQYAEEYAEENSTWNSDSSSSSNLSIGFLQSVGDAASTIDTQVSIVASNIDDAITTFVDLVFRSTDAQEALQVATENERVNDDQLAYRIRNCIKTFVHKLSQEVVDDHRRMVQIFHGRSLEVARRIVSQAIGRIGVQKRLSRLSNATHQASAQSDNLQDPRPEHDSEIDDQSSQDADEQPEAPDEAIDISEFTEFCASSYAFSHFIADIRELAFPTFTSKLKRLLSHTRRTWKDRSQFPEIEELFCELEYSQPSRIDMFVDKPDWTDWAKNIFEAYYGKGGDWWPLDPPRTPLRSHEVRISWKCVRTTTRSVIVVVMLILAF